MEIKQQLDLFADRTSTHFEASNQLRLWFSAFAHLILSRLQAEVLDEVRDEALLVLDLHRVKRAAVRVDSDEEIVLLLKGVEAELGHEVCSLSVVRGQLSVSDGVSK